jgi:hypothetical protein
MRVSVDELSRDQLDDVAVRLGLTKTPERYVLSHLRLRVEKALYKQGKELSRG